MYVEALDEFVPKKRFAINSEVRLVAFILITILVASYCFQLGVR